MRCIIAISTILLCVGASRAVDLTKVDRTMPSDQRCKRRFIALGKEALQKLAVRYVGVGLSCEG